MSQKSLVPEYYSEFRCIGDKCEDNCCHSWFITVEKPMYKKYRKIKDEKWRNALSVHVKRNKNAKDDASYAYLTLNENKECSFLSSEGLCNIHSSLGTSYLCESCSTYPRMKNKFNGNWEKSLSTSCPEAARLVLFKKEGINFTYTTEPGSLYLANEITYSIESPTYIKYFWEIRSFVIELLQNRSEKFEDRLKILGYFIDSLTNCGEEESIEFNKLINDFRSLVESKHIHEYFPISSTHEEKLYQFLLILKSRLHNPNMNKTFKNILENTIVGLKLNEEGDKGVKAYSDSIEKFNEFLNDKHYVLENYFVNIVFNSLMPNRDNPIKDYAILVNYYLILRTILIGRIALEKEMNDEYLVELVYSFGRTIENFNNFPEYIIETLYKNMDFSLISTIRLI